MFISHTAQSQWKGGSGIFQGPWQALNPRSKGMNIILTHLWCFNDLPTMLAFSFFFISGTQAFTVTILGCFWASWTALCGAQNREPAPHCHLMSLAMQAICSGSWQPPVWGIAGAQGTPVWRDHEWQGAAKGLPRTPDILSGRCYTKNTADKGTLFLLRKYRAKFKCWILAQGKIRSA